MRGGSATVVANLYVGKVVGVELECEICKLKGNYFFFNLIH